MRIVLLAALAMLPAAGMAQVYRCGTTYQSVPCEGGKKLDIQEVKRDEAREREFCDFLLQKRLKDPDSAKLITDWKFIGGQRYQGEAAIAYGRTINAKNSFGGYTGESSVICYLSTDGRRMLGLSTS